MPEKSRIKTKTWLPLLLVIMAVATFWFSGFQDYLSFETVQTQKEVWQQAVIARPLISALLFGLVYVVTVALSLPFATVLTLLGGFLFGKIYGTALVVLSATIGATTLFVIAKSTMGQTLRDKVSGLYQKIEQNMQENAVGYLLFMRLVPLFPFVLVNIVPALFNVKLRDFVLTTFLGIIPGSFVYVNLGEELGDIASPKDLVSQDTLWAFALLGLFALVPTLYKQWKAKTKKNKV